MTMATTAPDIDVNEPSDILYIDDVNVMCHVITEILLKVALKTIKQTNNILLINRNTTLKLQYI
jgi:hypothetical protein